MADYLSTDGSFFVNLKAHCEAGERVMYVMDFVQALRMDHGWRFVDEFAWVHGETPKAVVGPLQERLGAGLSVRART